MRFLLTLIACTLASAARADEDKGIHWAPPTAWEMVPLVAAQTLMLVDALQTIDAQRQGRTEGNPLLGTHPSNTRILVSTGAAALALTAIWYVMPSRLRVALPIGVFAAELGTVIENHTLGLRVRF